MAATKYQVMCRYFNTSTNNPITNSNDTQYEKLFGFYTIDKSEEISDFMIDGNSPANVKTDMLFSYAGTVIVYPDTEKYVSAEFKTPFMIVDQYERVRFSPWFINYTTTSLTAAVEKAKQLVSAIGMDNVKMIKLVPFDQFIKIK
jgi:hypothetical protein